MNIVIDCGCTNHIIPDKSMFKTLEGDGSAMFVTNGEYMVLEKFASHSTIVIKLSTRLISSAHSLYAPSFNFRLISDSLLVKQGNTIIFQQNPHIHVRQNACFL